MLVIPDARMLKAIDRASRQGTDEFLPMNALIAVGVGIATLDCDERVVHENADGLSDDAMTVAQAERLAEAAPDRDWRIHLIALLDDRHYRRVGPRAWRLYRRGYGLS